MRRDSLFGDQVHVPGPDLHLERLAFLRDDHGVQRLVEVRLGHGDVVLDPSGNRTPHLMNDAQRRVTVLHRRGDDAEPHVIVELANVDLLPPELRPDGEHRLHATIHFAGDLVLLQFRAERLLDAAHQLTGHRQLLVDRLLEFLEFTGM